MSSPHRSGLPRLVYPALCACVTCTIAVILKSLKGVHEKFHLALIGAEDAIVWIVTSGRPSPPVEVAYGSRWRMLPE